MRTDNPDDNLYGMDYQSKFERILTLLENNPLIFSDDGCIDEMKNDEGLLHLMELGRERFLQVYVEREEFARWSAQKVLGQEISAMLSSYTKLNGKDVNIISITTSQRTYIVFADKSLTQLYGVVKVQSNLANERLRIAECRQYGLSATTTSFLKGSFQGII